MYMYLYIISLYMSHLPKNKGHMDIVQGHSTRQEDKAYLSLLDSQGHTVRWRLNY